MAQILFTLEINAEREKVWVALTNNTSEWWSKELFTSEHTKKMELEAWLGGKLYEDFGRREGLIWSEVIGIKSPEFILLKGHLSPEYGGPATNFTKISLETKGVITSLHFTEDYIGLNDEKFNATMTKGWKEILGKLKKHLDQTS